MKNVYFLSNDNISWNFICDDSLLIRKVPILQPAILLLLLIVFLILIYYKVSPV